MPEMMGKSGYEGTIHDYIPGECEFLGCIPYIPAEVYAKYTPPEPAEPEISLKGAIPVGGFTSLCHKAEVVTLPDGEATYCTTCKRVCHLEPAYPKLVLKESCQGHKHFIDSGGFVNCLIGTPIEIAGSTRLVNPRLLNTFKDRFLWGFIVWGLIHVNPATVKTEVVNA